MSSKGYNHTEEARAKISSAGKGRIVSAETRAKISAAHKGRKQPESMKIKTSIRQGGSGIARSGEVLREHQFKRSLMELYSLSIDDYNRLIVDQNGLCQICFKQNKTGRKLNVDHDHKDGRVRGLLCKKCNFAIGLLDDDPVLFLNTFRYLRKKKNFEENMMELSYGRKGSGVSSQHGR